MIMNYLIITYWDYESEMQGYATLEEAQKEFDKMLADENSCYNQAILCQTLQKKDSKKCNEINKRREKEEKRKLLERKINELKKEMEQIKEEMEQIIGEKE